jgi:hypothetical protein
MPNETPRPETYRTPETSIFNVEAMSNEQIVVLYRGLATIFDATLDSDVMPNSSTGSRDQQGYDVYNAAGGMMDQLRADLRGLTPRDPERVKELVGKCAQSENEDDHDLAVEVVPSLLHHDYAFTRDTLISLLDSNLAGDSVILIIPRMMRDQLNQYQIEDFNAHLQARGEEPMSPARSDEEY